MGNSFLETEEQRRIREAEEARRLEEERRAHELRLKIAAEEFRIRQADQARLQAEREAQQKIERERLERRLLEQARLRAEEEHRAARARYLAEERERFTALIDQYIRIGKDLSFIVAELEPKRNKDAVPETTHEFARSRIQLMEQRRRREAEEARRHEEERRARELREKKAAEEHRIWQALQAKLQAEREAQQRRVARELYFAQEREEFAALVDEYIRTRRNFDDSDPLTYRCDISSIAAEFESERNQDAIPESIFEFVRSHSRFVVEGTKVGVRYLTPFQGESSHRVFGYFSCSECNRTWTSAASWKDKWQKCQHCETKIYPYRQHVLEKRDEDEDVPDSRRPHDMRRCQKCKDLGRLCVPSMYYAAYL